MRTGAEQGATGIAEEANKQGKSDTKVGGKSGPKPGGRGGRGKRAAAEEDRFIYCLDTGKGESGTIVLAKPGDKMEVLVSALKAGVSYYRLQKFTAKVENVEGEFKIVGIPVEQ